MYQRDLDSKTEVALVGLYSFVVCCTLAQEVFSFLFPFLLTLTFITAFQLLWPKEDKTLRVRMSWMHDALAMWQEK